MELLHLRRHNGADLQNHCYVFLSCGEHLWIDIIGIMGRFGFVPGSSLYSVLQFSQNLHLKGKGTLRKITLSIDTWIPAE